MARRAKGEGTLYQAKDKSWIYQYKVDGQRKTKRFQKKADARAYIEALTAAKSDSVQKSERLSKPLLFRKAVGMFPSSASMTTAPF